MEFLSQLLPIIIYFLLIIVIVIGIVVGIKLIITMDKVITLVDDVNKKIEKVTPVFDAVEFVSTRANKIVTSVTGAVENVLNRFVFKKKEDEENEEDE